MLDFPETKRNKFQKQNRNKITSSFQREIQINKKIKFNKQIKFSKQIKFNKQNLNKI